MSLIFILRLIMKFSYENVQHLIPIDYCTIIIVPLKYVCLFYESKRKDKAFHIFDHSTIS